MAAVEHGRESCLGAHSNVVSTEGLVEAGDHEFIVPQICEAVSWPVFSNSV